MKNIIKIFFTASILIFVACGGSEEKKEKEQFKIGQKPKVETKKETPTTDEVPASKRITLDNKGVGKIKNL